MLCSLVRGAVASAAALTLVMAASACSGPATAQHSTAYQSASPGWPRQSLAWRGCGHGEAFQAGAAVKGAPQCALLRVPTDYQHPDIGVQELAVTRIQARGTRKGVLFFNPGGPGVSATLQATDLAEALPPRIRAAFDLVAMDPRAVGESGYLSCTDPEVRTRKLPFDLAPDTDAERAALAGSRARLGRSCAERQPSLINHLGTADFARDVETLRMALRVDSLDLLGFSYGTLLAYEYARIHPDRVHRMVLDGVVVPGQPAPTTALAQAESSDQALYYFADACAAEQCALGITADKIVSRINGLQRTLDRRPLTVHGHPPDVAVDEGVFTSVLYQALYSDASAFELPTVIARLEHGDPSPLLKLEDDLDASQGGTLHNVVNGTYWATTCTDQPRTMVTDAQRRDIEAASITFGKLLAASASACQSWPTPAADLVGAALPSSTGLKAMLITNTDDPATPRLGAKAVAALLPGSSPLDVDIWGHTAALSGLECVDLALADFLMDGTRPPPAGCAAP